MSDIRTDRDEIVIGRFSDDPDLWCRARERFFGRRDDRLVRWHYGENPAGDAWGAMHVVGGEMAAQVLAVPFPLLVGGARQRVMRLVDGCTHAAFRNRGLYGGVIRSLLDRLAAENTAAVFGFPTAATLPMWLGRQGFSVPVPVYQMVRPLLPSRGMAALPQRFSALVSAGFPVRLAARLTGMRVTEPEAPDDEWLTALNAGNAAGSGVRLERGPAWVRWRYDASPKRAYRFTCVSNRNRGPQCLLVWQADPVVVRGRIRFVQLVDLAGRTGAPMIAAIQAFLEARAEHADGVLAQATRNTAEFSCLLACGFVPIRRIGMIYRRLAPDFEDAVLLARGAWSVTGAYHDVL